MALTLWKLEDNRYFDPRVKQKGVVRIGEIMHDSLLRAIDYSQQQGLKSVIARVDCKSSKVKMMGDSEYEALRPIGTHPFTTLEEAEEKYLS